MRSALHNRIMCELPCEETDEIWGFVAKKQRNVDSAKDNMSVVGDAWTFVAIDSRSVVFCRDFAIL
jgi:hypothetical protein